MPAVVALAYPWTMPPARAWRAGRLSGLLLLASAVFWLRQRGTELLVAGLATFAANLLAHVRQAYVLLEHTVLAAEPCRGWLPACWWSIGGICDQLAEDGTLGANVALVKAGQFEPGRACRRPAFV